ncbi:MAG TPA: imidazoleglycerol-phosphate dehydratase HisB [Kiritimatiellae bacterium]|nr:imidazoleglycerol-phosphate dehydratase HisB [Kiritimatiellia bacterium]
MRKRTAEVSRRTRETSVRVRVNLDGAGKVSVRTGLGFLDHMLELFGRHSLIDLVVSAKGDIHVDYHHTVEDVGLVMGKALDRALGTRKGISRYGWSIVPMDDALSWAAVDLGGRPYMVLQTTTRRRKILDFDLGLIRDFFQALVTAGKFNLHILQLYGKDPHHAYESVFKALARAMRMAVASDPREKAVPSTKGKI